MKKTVLAASLPEDEHDRYRRFVAQINLLKSANQSVLEELIRMALSEPDLAAREAELGLIAELEILKWDQREHLRGHAAFEPAHLQRRLRRAALLIELRSRDLTDSVFEECMQSSDSVVHRALLQSPSVTPIHLRKLQIEGANKAVRNVAAERLRSRS